jgi:hypothetical protein
MCRYLIQAKGSSSFRDESLHYYKQRPAVVLLRERLRLHALTDFLGPGASSPMRIDRHLVRVGGAGWRRQGTYICLHEG